MLWVDSLCSVRYHKCRPIVFPRSALVFGKRIFHELYGISQ
jgi:hypothetical protein